MGPYIDGQNRTSATALVAAVTDNILVLECDRPGILGSWQCTHDLAADPMLIARPNIAKGA